MVVAIVDGDEVVERKFGSSAGERQFGYADVCLDDLKSSPLPPRFSLANNLWIGLSPAELSTLTFPEQLLIAHLYQRVYVFKLFPKSGARLMYGLQGGVRGNVSTYELNVDTVAAMVGGELMPRPPTVLSSLIAITYTGAGPIPKNWIHSTFRVRRHHIARVLGWLKAKNIKYYGDVVIGQKQFDQLAEDDVPDEIIGVIRQSSDVGLVDQESSGYVQTEDIGLSPKLLGIESWNLNCLLAADPSSGPRCSADSGLLPQGAGM